MRKITVTTAFLLLYFYCFSQSKNSFFRSNSWQVQVFRITAAQAEQFIKWDSIPLSHFVHQQPVAIFKPGNWIEDSLSTGLYVFITAQEMYATVRFVCISDLIALGINNRNKQQFDIRNRAGEYIENAKVFVNDKEAIFNSSSRTFWVQDHKLTDAFVKVYTPGDTLYTTLDENDEHYIKPLWEQKRQAWRSSTFRRILNWVPSQLKKIFRKRVYSGKTRIGASGYIIFNQPKYKPLDTVRFKGYVLDKHNRQYKKDIAVHINYYHNGISQNQFIKTLGPVSDGAYASEFILADTFPTDTKCWLSFETPKKEMIIRNYFKTEDYVLDEIASPVFESSKDIYFRNDTLHFTASAKDANGLQVLDGSATLLLTTKKVNDLYRDTVFVPDTIYKKELPFTGGRQASFDIAPSHLPNVDITIRAQLIFRNANNELHNEEKDIEYKYQGKEIVVIEQQDSIKAVYIENGKEKVAIGEFYFNDETEKPIQFPATIKIDPIAEDYTFIIPGENGKRVASKTFDIKERYQLNFARISKGDTLGFILYNPYKIPVYYTVLYGKTIIATGKETGSEIKWQQVSNNRREAYLLRWQYYWAGKEEYEETGIGILYNLLNIKINTSSIVYPGQKDSVHIAVTDYKGLPAENVNLTAVSYNNQFSNSIRVEEPPYIAKYKLKNYLQYPGYITDGDAFGLEKKYLLGKNKEWINKLHLDTMPYYRLLFPKDTIQDEAWLHNNFTPQVSVNIVRQGVPQEIYLLYINRNLVYYNGVTDKMNYSFEVFPENVQLGIRLKDKYIEIDSLYIQPGYKHELSFDLDNLPPHSKLIPADNYWSTNEINLLESSVWQMKDDYYTNYAYLWQNSRLVHLDGNRQHTAGPFTPGSITFYNPGLFDTEFSFEPGYEYTVRKKLVRIEKHLLFPVNQKNYLPVYPAPKILAGDTIAQPPVINYNPEEKVIELETNTEYGYYMYSSPVPGKGALYVKAPKDSAIKYIILEPADTNINRIILPYVYYYSTIRNITPGKYTVLIITNKNYITQSQIIEIKASHTTCVKMDIIPFSKTNSIVDKIMAGYDVVETPVQVREPVNDTPFTNQQEVISSGGGVVKGRITDKKGKLGIPYASVKLKGTQFGTLANNNGYFTFKNLAPGKRTFEFAAVGYEAQDASVIVSADNVAELNIELKASTSALNEVVVTAAYGGKRNARTSSSIVSVAANDITNQLAGKVAGVQVTSGTSNEAGLLLRGANAILDSSVQPLYVVDGIIYETQPNIDPGNIQDISVLKNAAATSLYGARASNGVIMITTKTKTFRQQFKDYALWQPNFFSDKEGRASIPVQYPDNITAWKTYVVGMDKKNRMGKSFTLTQAYKPVMAELSGPQFLLEEDSVLIVGKNKNYTADTYKVQTQFTINGNMMPANQKELLPNSAAIETAAIIAGSDTVKASFTLQTTTGFKDGEERNIPVFKKGTQESEGNFWTLHNNSSVTFSGNTNLQELHIYAQNNTLDMALEDLEHLRNYPYYCMEQTASKLTGLALEKKIREQLGQPFTNQKEFDKLLRKIQKAQLFDGGWAWWENGQANFYITNYIANSLLPFRELPLVETNIRNAFLYLQNQLPHLDKYQLLSALSTLSNGGHEMNYARWLTHIRYDSLSQHQQWQYVLIEQQQKLDYAGHLKRLVDRKTETMFGSIHWGVNNLSWHSNDIATTLLAYKAISNEPVYIDLRSKVIQYFLEKKQSGHWANTVETATILDAILPQLLVQQKDFTKDAVVTITGDTSFVITKFPYKTTCSSHIKNIAVSKGGGGIVYCTAYQNFFNTAPAPVTDKFIISTYFKQNNQQVATVKAGEKTIMTVTVNVLKDAEYVQVEVPIPAGCTYSGKTNNSWAVFREYFKDKVVLFTESLPKGQHVFEIELEPRYDGSFTLNPAKASLMYFPIFFGRNSMARINIRN